MSTWETGFRTNEKGLIIKTEIGLMEIGLIEIGLKQLLARKICNYVDQIDKITTCSIVNIRHKSGTTKNAEADENKIQIGNVEHESRK